MLISKRLDFYSAFFVDKKLKFNFYRHLKNRWFFCTLKLSTFCLLYMYSTYIEIFLHYYYLDSDLFDNAIQLLKKNNVKYMPLFSFHKTVKIFN